MDPPEVPTEEPYPYSFNKYVKARQEAEHLEKILVRGMWRLLRDVNDWAKAHNIQLGARQGIPNEERYFKAVEGDNSYILVVRPRAYEMQVEQYLEDPALIGRTSYASHLGTMGYNFDPEATDAKFLGIMGYYFDPVTVEASEQPDYSRQAFIGFSIGFSLSKADFKRAEFPPNAFGWRVRKPGDEEIWSFGSGEKPEVDPFVQGRKILSLLSNSQLIQKLDPDQGKIL